MDRGLIPVRFVKREHGNGRPRWWRLWKCHAHGWDELREGPGYGVSTIMGEPTPDRPTRMMWSIR